MRSLSCTSHRKPWALANMLRRSFARTPQETTVGMACPWVRKQCPLKKMLGFWCTQFPQSESSLPEDWDSVKSVEFQTWKEDMLSVANRPGWSMGMESAWMAARRMASSSRPLGARYLHFLSTFAVVQGLGPACRLRNPVFCTSNRIHLSGVDSSGLSP